MRHTAHPAVEPRPGVLIPRIAVPAAHADLARVEIADSAKCFRRSLHRVAADRSVYMEIDKPGREIIATKIDDICGCLRLLPDLRNFSLLRYDPQAFTNSVWENETRGCKNHAVHVQRPMPNVQYSTALPELIAVTARSVHFSSCDEFRIRRRNHRRRVFRRRDRTDA